MLKHFFIFPHQLLEHNTYCQKLCLDLQFSTTLTAYGPMCERIVADFVVANIMPEPYRRSLPTPARIAKAPFHYPKTIKNGTFCRSSLGNISEVIAHKGLQCKPKTG